MHIAANGSSEPILLKNPTLGRKWASGWNIFPQNMPVKNVCLELRLLGSKVPKFGGEFLGAEYFNRIYPFKAFAVPCLMVRTGGNRT